MSIENRYAPPLRNIEVTKIWKDEVGPLRPDVITLLGRRLGMICSADQQHHCKSSSKWRRIKRVSGPANASGLWLYSFKELPEFTGIASESPYRACLASAVE